MAIDSARRGETAKPIGERELIGGSTVGPGQLPYFRGRGRAAAARRAPTVDAAFHGLVAQLWLRSSEDGSRRGGRRGLAPVDAGGVVPRRIEMEQEGAAADAGGLRLDQREHHLRGDGGIDRRAASRDTSSPASAASGSPAATMCSSRMTTAESACRMRLWLAQGVQKFGSRRRLRSAPELAEVRQARHMARHRRFQQSEGQWNHRFRDDTCLTQVAARMKAG